VASFSVYVPPHQLALMLGLRIDTAGSPMTAARLIKDLGDAGLPASQVEAGLAEGVRLGVLVRAADGRYARRDEPQLVAVVEAVPARKPRAKPVPRPKASRQTATGRRNRKAKG
jgi:hypothetical protein